MDPSQALFELAYWTKFSLVTFVCATAVTFVIAATKRPWTSGPGGVVIAPAAKLALVIGGFAVVATDAIAFCDLAINVDVREPLERLLGGTATLIGALVGFWVAVHLDPVVREALPAKVAGATGAGLKKDVPHAAGLRRVATKGGTGLCWTCGKTKGSAEHLNDCPAGKEGTS